MESSLNQDASFLGIVFAAAEMVSQVWVSLSSLPILIYVKMDSIIKTGLLLIAISISRLYSYTFTIYQDVIIAISISFIFNHMTTTDVVKVTEDTKPFLLKITFNKTTTSQCTKHESLDNSDCFEDTNSSNRNFTKDAYENFLHILGTFPTTFTYKMLVKSFIFVKKRDPSYVETFCTYV